jgi:hypothetical protein
MPDSLVIEPNRSRILAATLICVHVAAASLAVIALSQWWLRLAISMAAAVSLAEALRRAALRSAPSAVVRLELGTEGRVLLTRRDGGVREARLSRSSFLSPWLAILVLTTGRLRPATSVVLLPDSLPPDDFRRLRVWLRWRAPVAAE